MHICISKTPSSLIGQKKICHRWVIPFDEYLVNRPWQAWWCSSLESGCNRFSIFVYIGFPQSPQHWIPRFDLRFGGGSCPKTIAPSPENAAFSRDCSRNCCWVQRKLVCPQGCTLRVSSGPAFHSLQPLHQWARSASQPLFTLACPQLTWAKMFRKMFKEVGSDSSRMAYDMRAGPVFFCFTVFPIQPVLAWYKRYLSLCSN